MVELKAPAWYRNPKVIAVALVLPVGITVGWIVQRTNALVQSGECTALYRAALTPADSARVDAVLPEPGGRYASSRPTCREVRTAR